MHRTLGILAVLVASSCSTPAATFEVSVPPKDGEKYKSADVRVWLPDNVKTIRALIVHQHGCGRNGIDNADDLQWQALAIKHDAALIGSYFVPVKDCSDWFDPKNGSERAFFDALKEIAAKSKHPELTAAPWAIWGHSGGSMWACHMTIRHPARTVAVWARSQAVIEGYPDAALQVPIVFNYGEQEKTGRFEGVHKNSVAAFEKYRPKGALWAIAVDPKSSHDCRNSRQLAIPFFDLMLAERLPDRDVGGTTLRPPAALAVRVDRSYLGDLTNFRVRTQSAIKEKHETYAWLPSSEFAMKWQEYCQRGDVMDTTAPPSATTITAKVGVDGVTVEWKAVADLESGIKLFKLRRDGFRIAEIGGEKTKGNGMGFFQFWNYGDEPEPRLPAFKYLDKGGKAGSKYEITVENHAGLHSEKSPEGVAK